MSTETIERPPVIEDIASGGTEAPREPDPDDESKDEDDEYTATWGKPPVGDPSEIEVKVRYPDGSVRTMFLEPFPNPDGAGQRLEVELEWMRATRHTPEAIITGGVAVEVMPWLIVGIRGLGRMRKYRSVDADGVVIEVDEDAALRSGGNAPGESMPTLTQPPADPEPEGEGEGTPDQATTQPEASRHVDKGCSC